ncbi:hypothetical protein HY949_04760 [Candidatus Gottesmanbacteria bacterium]|nr:hypothetical protein [Candidatus Gottesmanbacteria bacterium]
MANVGFDSELRFVYPAKTIEGSITYSHEGSSVVFQVKITDIEGDGGETSFKEGDAEFLVINKDFDRDSLSLRQRALAKLLTPVLEAASVNWAQGLSWMDRSPQGKAAADTIGGIVKVGVDQSSIYDIPSELEPDVMVLFSRT